MYGPCQSFYGRSYSIRETYVDKIDTTSKDYEKLNTVHKVIEVANALPRRKTLHFRLKIRAPKEHRERLELTLGAVEAIAAAEN